MSLISVKTFKTYFKVLKRQIQEKVFFFSPLRVDHSEVDVRSPNRYWLKHKLHSLFLSIPFHSFKKSYKTSHMQPLIEQTWSQCLVFNHLSLCLYFLSFDLFSLPDGQTFSTFHPNAQSLSHLLNHFYFSLTVQSDNRVTRGGLSLSNVDISSHSLYSPSLPFLSAFQIWTKPARDNLPRSPVKNCPFRSTEYWGGLVHIYQVSTRPSSINSGLKWPVSLHGGCSL